MSFLKQAAVACGLAMVIAMVCATAFSPALAAAENTAERAAELATELATELAQDAIVVDTHIDVPYRLQEAPADVTQATENGDFDYPRAKSGGLDAAFMSIYLPAELSQQEAYRLANELIDSVEAIAKRAPKKFAIATSPADVRHHHERGFISLPLGMENGEAISGDLDKLEHFHERGIRYITLAHSLSNHISDSSYDSNRPWRGLSPFGKKLVPAMNDIGMMIDVSHISDEAFWDVMELSDTPVIASHSSARHFTPGFERNMSDNMIKALAENGGVIQINFGSSFLTGKANAWYSEMGAWRKEYMIEHGIGRDDPRTAGFEAGYRAAHPFPYADVDIVLDHIDHVVELVGVDHVGIGSDYDGVGDSLPVGLKSVADYPNLVAGLLKRGYSEADIRKILGGNILRVWEEVEARAASKR